MTVRPLAVRFAVLSALIALAPPARAQSASAQAELLFRRGRDLMAAGKLAEACAAFEASNKLETAATTLLNLGACREKNGQLATAFGAYSSAEREARQATDATSKELARVAADHVARLEPHLSKLTIRVRDSHRVPGLEVRRGAEVVDPATWNQPLAVDGGTYEIVASAPGHVAWTKTIDIAAEGDERSVAVPALAAEPIELEHERAAAVQPTGSPSRALPIAFGALAVGMIGGAVGFELWGDETYDKAKVEPDWTKQDNLWASANHKRYAAEAFAAGGVACAAVAIWLYVRGGETTSTPIASVRPGGVSIGIARAF